VIDIKQFNERMRDERIARNKRWLRNLVWTAIGVLLGANLVDIVRAYL